MDMDFINIPGKNGSQYLAHDMPMLHQFMGKKIGGLPYYRRKISP
jgi:hypothetical protein